MSMQHLEFEKPIAELELKIEELRRVGSSSELNLSDEIERLEAKSQTLTQQIYAKLTPHQIVQIARHPQRPYTADIIKHTVTDFHELHGDRHGMDDAAIIGGTAYFAGQPVMVIGQQKGRGTKDKLKRNFGMPQPEGFRKALRLMRLAEKFKLPILTLIDTPGAYPGITAEEHNQSEAIARNLYEMMRIKTPIICTIIGEGCSGGALGIGVGDRTLMLQYSYFSVISPEGCATILWKSATKAQEAAEALNLTAQRLLDLKLIDAIITEPEGGAHRDVKASCDAISACWQQQLTALLPLDVDALVAARYQRYMDLGRK